MSIFETGQWFGRYMARVGKVALFLFVLLGLQKRISNLQVVVSVCRQLLWSLLVAIIYRHQQQQKHLSVLTLTREFPIGEPPKKFNFSKLLHSDSGTTNEFPVRTPAYPSTYMRRVKPEIFPSLNASIQYLASCAIDDDRQGARPPDVIMPTLTCVPAIEVCERT